MHYDGHAFSKNGKVTMEPLDPSVVLQGPYYQVGIQDTDALQINTIYNCKADKL